MLFKPVELEFRHIYLVMSAKRITVCFISMYVFSCSLFCVESRVVQCVHDLHHARIEQDLIQHDLYHACLDVVNNFVVVAVSCLCVCVAGRERGVIGRNFIIDLPSQ